LRWFVLGEETVASSVATRRSDRHPGWRSLREVFRKKSLDLKDASDMTDDTLREDTSNSEILANTVPVNIPVSL
jgi:chloramphenicol 3-O-phosphotransferase